MGEKQTKPFQLSFNGLLKVDFQGSHVTSDGGLILVRELDERLGLGELIDEHLSDSRQGTNKQFTFADLLRQSVYSRLAGYEEGRRGGSALNVRWFIPPPPKAIRPGSRHDRSRPLRSRASLSACRELGRNCRTRSARLATPPASPISSRTSRSTL